jgi:nucleotide-binding universal stress UspA family protein
VLVEHSADAAPVVVGSRGRGPVASLLLGSVGVTLVRHASCPVVVLRPPTTPRWGGVLVGVDGTERSVAALEFAFRQAAGREVPLTVLHSWAATAPQGVDRADLPAAERALVARCRQVVTESIAGLREKYADVAVRIETTRMPPAEALVDAAAGRDLVVVGRRHRPPVLGTVHGSVSAAVVEHAAATVVVVPTP